MPAWSVLALTTVPPAYEFALDSVSVPPPTCCCMPLPEMIQPKVTVSERLKTGVE
jgi:hypothetical protein